MDAVARRARGAEPKRVFPPSTETFQTRRGVFYIKTHTMSLIFHVTLTFLGGLTFTVDDGEEVEDLKVLGVDGC